MSLTGQGLADFAKKKLGTPYVYGAKGVDGPFTKNKLKLLMKAYPNIFTTTYQRKASLLIGRTCCDCSGLVSWYTGKDLGSAELYSHAYTRLPIAELSHFAPGVVLWKPGHVAVYLGDNTYVEIEEKGIDYGCVKDDARKRKFQYGLTFSWMTYSYSKRVQGTWKGVNPYKTPTRTMKEGAFGEDVKWLQWELQEAGYTIAIDGKFGSKTDDIVRAFQQSCKIASDGIVGPLTRKKLMGD